MKERWILQQKKGDFNGLAKEFSVSPLVIRCLINRGIRGRQEIRQYLFGSLEDLLDPWAMKDIDRAVELLWEAAQERKKIAIASDFDCDGILSGYILWKAFSRLGMDSRIYTPDRIQEGYGLNERIVDEAAADGRTLLVTCDNGIAANPQVDYARERGMIVIVTDHHEVQEEMPGADAVIDPKREDDTYPFDGLCGAGVAFKLICALYDRFGIPEAAEELLEYVAIATVADVMELRGENRILVKYGLQALKNTKNPGLKALIQVQGLDGKEINAGHVGFILGPCFNAAGRIATVAESFSLLMEEDGEKALEKAERLKEINEERKYMTEKGAERAFAMVEALGSVPDVLILLLPDVHESLVGIIAGRVKERYCHPVIVFTRTGNGLVKGSGRSIENYHMFRELMKCKDLMRHFGGHKMAAGMTLAEEDLSELKRRLNENSTLSAEDFRPLVYIDAAMPLGYMTEGLLEEFEKMEPFGVGNPKPVFAEQHFRIRRGRRIGKGQQFLKLLVENDRGNQCDALYFGEADAFDRFVVEEWGQAELDRMYEGRENELDVAFTYFPTVNEYMGKRTIQIQISGYCRVRRSV